MDGWMNRWMGVVVEAMDRTGWGQTAHCGASYRQTTDRWTHVWMDEWAEGWRGNWEGVSRAPLGLVDEDGWTDRGKQGRKGNEGRGDHVLSRGGPYGAPETWPLGKRM